MNTPNKLTVFRIVLVPIYLLLMVLDFPFHYLAAGLVFGLAALTDLFDGRIARSRGLITNLGKFLDPLADKMLTTTAFLAFLAIGQLDVWAVTIILSREFMVTSVRLVAAADGTVIAASMWGKAKTVSQFIAIIYMIAALEFSTWQTSLLTALDGSVFSAVLTVGRVFIWISVALTVISGIHYIWNGREFLKKH